MKRLFSAFSGLQFFVLACAVLAGTGGGHAATLTVTNTADSGTGSLRQALADASDGDTIDFDAALNGQTISLTSGELAIDREHRHHRAGTQFARGVEIFQLTALSHLSHYAAATLS